MDDVKEGCHEAIEGVWRRPSVSGPSESTQRRRENREDELSINRFHDVFPRPDAQCLYNSPQWGQVVGVQPLRFSIVLPITGVRLSYCSYRTPPDKIPSTDEFIDDIYFVQRKGRSSSGERVHHQEKVRKQFHLGN